ncbi:hypothetical protein GEMRC1_012172 [Eukaryota sp. GEM-RC1]
MLLHRSSRFKEVKSDVPPPGSYNIPTSSRKIHARVPFGSTSSRNLTSTDSSFVTPSPSSYEIPSSFQQSSFSSTSSAFKSSKPRFSNLQSDAPSPGSYNLNQDWIKPTHRIPPPTTSSPPPDPEWNHVSTAPSIPNHRRFFGYYVDETTGTLVMIQPPPNMGFSGTTSADAVGPTDYNPKPPPRQVSFTTSNWSSSKKERFSEPKATAPPPGSYDVSRIFEKSSKPSSAPFSSSAQRTAGLTPSSTEFDDPPPVGLQSINNAPNLITIPGRTGGKSRRASRKTPQPAFNQAQVRFKEEKEQGLGPGQYNDDYLSLTNQLQRRLKLASKKSPAFGARGRDMYPVEAPPPPSTNYNARTTQVKPKPKKRSAVFASSQGPPPTKYDSKIPSFKPVRNPSVKAPFTTTSDRFKMETASSGPDVGLYDPNSPTKKSFSKKSSLYANERFRESTQFVTPPPGAYAVEKPFIKQSYNVSFC